MGAYDYANRSDEILYAIQSLTISLKLLDLLELPIAAAHVDAAINELGSRLVGPGIPPIIELNASPDFSTMDTMAEELCSQV